MAGSMIRIFVPDVPELAALVRAAKQSEACRVSVPLPHYVLIESERPLQFSRRELGLKPAVWYGLLTGGITGHIERFDREVLRVVPKA